MYVTNETNPIGVYVGSGTTEWSKTLYYYIFFLKRLILSVTNRSTPLPEPRPQIPHLTILDYTVQAGEHAVHGAPDENCKS